MNTYMQAKHLTDMLCESSMFRRPSINSIRAGSDYRLFFCVPAHCLTLKNTAHSSPPELPNVIIDLLICRGKEAIYAIMLDADESDTQNLFHTHLQGLPHCFLNSDEMSEDLAREICGEIEFHLRCNADAPVHTECFLCALSVPAAASRMKAPAVSEKVNKHLLSFLQEKHLVSGAGTVTPYGRACGLFQRCSVTRPHVYATVPHCVSTLHRAMLWYDCDGDSQSLKSKLSRIKQGLPVEAAPQHTQSLRNLLNMQLEEYFARYPQDLTHLRTLLAHGQYLSFGSKVSAFGDRESIETYGDVIYAVRNLWEHTAQRDCNNLEVTETCSQILTFLFFPLWAMPEISAAEAFADPASNTLQERLRCVLPEIYHTPLTFMSLQQYFYAAACLTESEYPLWLYRISVKPMLTFYRADETLCIRALNAVYKLSQSESECENADYFPLLYDILVAPFSGIV